MSREGKSPEGFMRPCRTETDREVLPILATVAKSSRRLSKYLSDVPEGNGEALPILSKIAECNQQLIEILSRIPEPDNEVLGLLSEVTEDAGRILAAVSAYLGRGEEQLPSNEAA